MKCRVKINTKQYNSNLDTDEIEFIADGELIYKNNEIYVVYKDKNNEDEKLTTNTIKIKEDEVSMIKYGDKSSTMIFKENREYASKYKTSYGIFLIDILTKKLTINKSETCIDIKIDYNLEMQDLFKGRNVVSVKIETL